MKRLPVFRNREAYCHECGNNFLEKGMPWKISYKPDCQENKPKVNSLCKLLFLRYLRWSKIQGTYFKISALYFKIYGLCFSQQGLCFLRRADAASRITVMCVCFQLAKYGVSVVECCFSFLMILLSRVYLLSLQCLNSGARNYFETNVHSHNETYTKFLHHSTH